MWDSSTATTPDLLVVSSDSLTAQCIAYLCLLAKVSSYQKHLQVIPRKQQAKKLWDQSGIMFTGCVDRHIAVDGWQQADASTYPWVVVQDRSVYRIAKFLVHSNGKFIWFSNKQINEKGIVGLFTNIFKQIHEILGEAETTILWRYSHSWYVAMPQRTLALCFSDNIPHQSPIRRLCHCKSKRIESSFGEVRKFPDAKIKYQRHKSKAYQGMIQAKERDNSCKKACCKFQ